MKNAQMDSNGALRCWSCGSTALLAKRTGRSKVAFGVAALAAKKKLKCQACGSYNDTGSADTYREPVPADPSAPGWWTPPDGAEISYEPRAGELTTIKTGGLGESVAFDGETVTVRTLSNKNHQIPLSRLRGITLESQGRATALWFATPGAAKPGSRTEMANDPACIYVTPKHLDDVRGLVARIEAQRSVPPVE